jgi:hypothetical protein
MFILCSGFFKASSNLGLMAAASAIRIRRFLPSYLLTFLPLNLAHSRLPLPREFNVCCPGRSRYIDNVAAWRGLHDDDPVRALQGNSNGHTFNGARRKNQYHVRKDWLSHGA